MPQRADQTKSEVAPRTGEWRGTRVPYIAAWSGEGGDIDVRLCPYVKRDATWQPQRIGAGKPLWKTLHPVRQRECVVLGLCHICGEAMPQEDRWVHVGALQPNSAAQWLAGEALLCGPCVEYSKTACRFIAKLNEQFPAAFQRVNPKMRLRVLLRDLDEELCERLGFSWRKEWSSRAPAHLAFTMFEARDAIYLRELGGRQVDRCSAPAAPLPAAQSPHSDADRRPAEALCGYGEAH